MSRILSTGGAAALFRACRRVHTVAVKSVKGQPGAPAIGKSVEEMVKGGGAVGKRGVEKEVYWMRDPKTGNWKPETHFDEVDIVEARENILKQTNLKHS